MMVTRFLSVPGTWLYLTVIIALRVDLAASHCVVTWLPWSHQAGDQAMSAACVSHSVQVTSLCLQC